MNSNLTKVIAHENKRCSIALDKSPSSENWNELKRQPNIGDETIFLQQNSLISCHHLSHWIRVLDIK